MERCQLELSLRHYQGISATPTVANHAATNPSDLSPLAANLLTKAAEVRKHPCRRNAAVDQILLQTGNCGLGYLDHPHAKSTPLSNLLCTHQVLRLAENNKPACLCCQSPIHMGRLDCCWKPRCDVDAGKSILQFVQVGLRF